MMAHGVTVGLSFVRFLESTPIWDQSKMTHISGPKHLLSVLLILPKSINIKRTVRLNLLAIWLLA